MSFKYKQRHVTVAVVVAVEQGKLLPAVCVDVRVVTVEYDVSGGFAPVRLYEKMEEQFLDGKQIILCHHVLKTAHGGRGAQLGINVSGNAETHHGVLAGAVTVIHIFITHAYLEYACHQNLMQRVANKIIPASVIYAGGYLT